MGRECEKGRECERTVNAKGPASASPANGEAPEPAQSRIGVALGGATGALSVVVHVEGVLHRDRALVEYRAEQSAGLRLHAIDERLIRVLEFGDRGRVVHIVQVRDVPPTLGGIPAAGATPVGTDFISQFEGLDPDAAEAMLASLPPAARTNAFRATVRG